MRSWVFSAGLIAPVSTKRTRPWAKSGACGPGGQPDGQPPGGDVVDGGAAAVGGGDAVGDEPLVQRQVRERPVLGQPVGAVLARAPCRCRSRHRPCGVSGRSRHAAAVMRRARLVSMLCVWSIGCLPVWLPGWLAPAGGSGSRGGWEACAIASGPVRPSSAAQLWMNGQSRWSSWRSLFGGGVGQDHRGDGAVAVQDLAGQPGHFPAVLAVRCVPGGVGGLVAGHGGVVDGQGHGSHFRVGVMVRLPGRARVRGCVRFPGARPATEARLAASRGAGRPRSRTRDGLVASGRSSRGTGGHRGPGSRAGPCPPAAGPGQGTIGLAAGSGFVWCLAGVGHWPASLSAARLD